MGTVADEFVDDEITDEQIAQWLDVNSDNPEIHTIFQCATDSAELWKMPSDIPENVRFMPGIKRVVLVKMLI